MVRTDRRTLEKKKKKYIDAGYSEKGAKAAIREGELEPAFKEKQAKEMPGIELKKKVKEEPSEFGLQKPGDIIEKPESIEIVEKQKEEEKTGVLSTLNKGIPGIPTETGTITGDIGASLERFGESPGAQLIAGLGISKLAYSVGGKILTGKKAVQAGNAAKNIAITKPLFGKISAFAIGAYAAIKGAESIAGYFTGRKIDEQQQALNTLGQMATTIGGQAQEGSGDWRKGLQELNYLKNEILRLEGAIKTGTIQSAAIKYNGKIYDINADIADQLATIDEQITIIQSFVLTQSFPELNELDMQNYLRELEEEGYIKPVDLTTSRRETE